VKTYSMQYGFTKIPFTVYVDIVYPWSIPVSMNSKINKKEVSKKSHAR
jgi:hypothetical protein